MAYRITINSGQSQRVMVGTSDVARTDAELESLKAEYREKIAAAEAAKVAADQTRQEAEQRIINIAKDLDLTPIAKEATLISSKEEILDAINDKQIEITAISEEHIQALFPAKE